MDEKATQCRRMMLRNPQHGSMIMKIATHLSAAPSPEELPASEMPELHHLPNDGEDEFCPVVHAAFSISTLQEDSEYLGVGATTVEDVIGLNFLDSFRSQIQDNYEEYSRYGPGCEYFTLELEFDT